MRPGVRWSAGGSDGAVTAGRGSGAGEVGSNSGYGYGDVGADWSGRSNGFPAAEGGMDEDLVSGGNVDGLAVRAPDGASTDTAVDRGDGPGGGVEIDLTALWIADDDGAAVGRNGENISTDVVSWRARTLVEAVSTMSSVELPRYMEVPSLLMAMELGT